MATKNYEGVGITVTFGTTAVTLELVDVNLPGWEREVIDVSHLGQSADDYKMKVLAKLKDMPSFDIEVHQEPATAFNTSWARNELISIAFPDSIGTLAFWGGVSAIAQGNNTMDDKPTDTYTITPTNRNGSGTYTAPAWS